SAPADLRRRERARPFDRIRQRRASGPGDRDCPRRPDPGNQRAFCPDCARPRASGWFGRGSVRLSAFDASETSATTRSAATGTGWLLATVCVAALVGYASSIALSPFLLPIANELHLTVALVGQVPAVAMAAAAALGLVIGPLADHYGYRRTMLLGLLALVLGSWGTALAVGYGGLLLANVGSAGSQAIVPSVALAIVGTRIPPELRRRAISWVMAATAGANIVGLPLLTGVAALFDWRAAFVALGLLALAVTLVEVRALPLDETKEGK